jgi:hypothetical protein
MAGLRRTQRAHSAVVNWERSLVAAFRGSAACDFRATSS